MSANDTIKLLLIHDSVDEANRLVSLLRNAGYNVSPKHAESERDLPKLLQNASWDLILAQFECNTISPQSIFHHARRLNRDIPVVLIAKDLNTSVVEGLRMGASDTLGMDEDQHLLLVVSRTLYNLNQRRRLRYWKRRYSEAETRCQQLLHSSRDAIAIVKEGTYIYANDSYAQLFGYMDREEMLCLPVIDTVAPESQNKIKPLLKSLFTEEAWEPQELQFTALRADDLPIDIHMSTAQVEYEDEPALQFLIKSDVFQYQDNNAEVVQTQNNLTEIRLHKLIEQINTAIRRATQMNKDSLLLQIQLDQFAELRQENGIKISEDLLHQVGKKIDTLITDNHVTGRYQEDSFLVLMPDTDADAALRLAENLCHQLANDIIEIGDQTFAVTLSIGLSVISDAISTVESILDRCQQAIDSVHAKDGAGNGAKLYELEFSPSIKEIDTNIEAMGRKLLGNNQFEILYQPIIGLHGESKPTYEALIRVNADANPKDFPVDFIAQLFKTEAAREIDRWVIHEAVMALSEKQRSDPSTRLFINISHHTFCDPEFTSWLDITLKPVDISPSSLVFQLSEIEVGRHLNHATAVVDKLKKMGGHVSLVHFGVSINPLQLLERLPVDFVKLDRQLVDKAYENEEGQEALENIINTLRATDEKVIVPFIESPALMPTLWRLGVQYIQGYYLQAPQPNMSYDFNSDA